MTAPTACVDPRPTYADIAPIIERRCSSCHTGAKGEPWPLDDYESVADWWDVIRDELVSCSMPPPDSGVMMSAAERDGVLMWLRCGFPR